MPRKAQGPQNSGESRPVPKEGESTTGVSSTQATQTNTESPTTPLAGLSPAQEQTGTVQPQQVVQQAPPAQTPPQQVVAKEKKGGGMCNTTTCCIASCVGCLLIVVILVLLGIFAAPTLSRLLNQAINPGVNVPEITEVDTTQLEQDLDEAAISEQQQTITVTEDEFNALLGERLQDTGEGSLDFNLRTDFEQDTATFYFKLTEWMPWGTIEIKNDENGNLSTGAIKLGPMDISSYFEDALEQQLESSEQDISTDELDLTSLFAEVLFEGNAEKVTIEGIYFYKDEMKAVVVSTSGDEQLETEEAE